MNEQALKFLADESCDFAFVRVLRQNEYDVKAIVEVMPGASDLKVLESGFEEKRVLLTEDKDFDEFNHRQTHLQSCFYWITKQNDARGGVFLSKDSLAKIFIFR